MTGNISAGGTGGPFVRLVEILAETYADEGIAAWLASSNDRLYGQTPIVLIARGEIGPVIAAAEQIGEAS